MVQCRAVLEVIKTRPSTFNEKSTQKKYGQKWPYFGKSGSTRDFLVHLDHRPFTQNVENCFPGSFIFGAVCCDMNNLNQPSTQHLHFHQCSFAVLDEEAASEDSAEFQESARDWGPTHSWPWGLLSYVTGQKQKCWQFANCFPALTCCAHLHCATVQNFSIF